MHCGPMRDRILTRPRLPAPAQARASVRLAGLSSNGDTSGDSRLRSDSPPRISLGLPPETRRVSGVLQTGLISEARNARPLTTMEETRKPRPLTMIEESRKPAVAKEMEKRLSLSIDITPIRLMDDDDDEVKDDGRLEIQSPVTVDGFTGYDSDRGRSVDDVGIQSPPPSVAAVRAERPIGVYASGAVYCGRALAEWSMVVSECNSFVDRRRDEGVLGLSDVEVPALSVEGLGLRARG